MHKSLLSWVLKVNVSGGGFEIAIAIHSEIFEMYITLDEDIHCILSLVKGLQSR